MEGRGSIGWFLWFFAMILSGQAIGFQKPAEEVAPFQWLDSLGETSGLKYATHRLRPISLQTEAGPPVEIETEETQLDSQNARIVRRAFSTSANGARILYETTVEEIKRLPGDGFMAVRTVSRQDANGRVAYLNDQMIELSARELSLLEVLLQRAGRLVSKDQLVERLCEWGEEVSNNAIEVYIHRLRKKIEQGPIRIATVRGLGYCLEKIPN